MRRGPQAELSVLTAEEGGQLHEWTRRHKTSRALAVDPAAMPLRDFIKEVMGLLSATPQAPEIVVKQAMALRYAEQNGAHEAIFQGLNHPR